MIVRLRQDLPADQVPSRLSFDRDYLVLEVEADDLRLLNDDGDPVLYERDMFIVVDPSIPHDWQWETGEGGEKYGQPGGLPDVWEDYHDDIPEARAIIQSYLDRIGPCSWPSDPLSSSS